MFSYPDPENPSVLEYQIELEADPDSIAIDILLHNEIPGIVPVSKRQVDGLIRLKYDGGSALPGSIVLRGAVSDSDVVAYLKSITEGLLNAQRFMLDESNYVLDPDSVYFSSATKSAALLYLPIKGQQPKDIREFLDRLVQRFQPEPGSSHTLRLQIRDQIRKTEKLDLRGLLKYLLTLEVSLQIPEQVRSAPSQNDVIPQPLVSGLPPAGYSGQGSSGPAGTFQGPPPVRPAPGAPQPQTFPSSPIPHQAASVAPALAPSAPVSAAPVPSGPSPSGPVPSPPPHKYQGANQQVPAPKPSKGAGKARKGQKKSVPSPGPASTEKPMSLMYLLAHYSAANKKIYDEQRAAAKASAPAGDGSMQHHTNGAPQPAATPGMPSSPRSSLPAPQHTVAAPPPGGQPSLPSAPGQHPQLPAGVQGPALGLPGDAPHYLLATETVSEEDFGHTVLFGQQEPSPAVSAPPPQPAVQADSFVLPVTTSPDLENPSGPTASAGQSAPNHAVIVRVSTGELFTVDSDEFVIGRTAEGADLSLSDRTVSKRHATVYRDAAGWSIQDRGATNGVILNGTQVPQGSRVPLLNGTTILLGDEELRFEVRS